MLYDDGEPVAEPCPKCGSTQTASARTFMVALKCEECSTLFYDKEYMRVIAALTEVAQDYLKQLNDGTATAKTVNISGLDLEV